MTVFDIKSDLKKPCYCQACFVDKKKSEMANDKYCHECQAVIDYEYSLRASQPFSAPQSTKYVKTLIEKPVTKMSTLKSRPRTYRKRALPEELIKRLNAQGLGSKAIASQLKDKGIIVSYKTIQRLLNGKRQKPEGQR